MCDANFIVHGPPNPLPDPDMSLGHYFYQQCQVHAEKPSQIAAQGDSETMVTHGELLRQGKMVGKLLRDKGLKVGDTVAVCCGNTLEFTPIMLGTLFIGASVAPINPDYEASDLAHLLSVLIPDIIFCNNQTEPNMRAAMAKLSKVPEFMKLDDLMKLLKDAPDTGNFQLADVGNLSKAVAFVLNSSGTSGRPKGIELSHGAIQQMLLILRPKGTMMEGGDVVLGVSGPYWVSGLMVLMMSLDKGTKVILLPLFKESLILDTIHKYKVNFAILGPSQMVALAKYPYDRNLELPSLRQVSFGGAKMSRIMYELAKQRLGMPITPVYGMTEIVATVAPAHGVHDRPGTIGKLFPMVQAMVVDVETRKPLGPDCEGELMFKAPTVMNGYRNNPEATKAAFDENGFMFTGDIGHYDKDGFFYVTDRIKELIKYQGVQVAAVDMEEVLLSHPGVLEAAVVGIHHDDDQERSMGFIVKKPGNNVTEEELHELIKSKLPKIKWLHGGIMFIPKMPKTPAGKTSKRALRASVTSEADL